MRMQFNLVDGLGLLFRWLHILAAMAAVGGPIFIRLALLPAVATLPEEERKRLNETVRSRWSKVVMAAILFLLISGFYNFFAFRSLSATWGDSWQPGSANAWTYQMLFGVKFLLALAIFFIASALTGRSTALVRFRENAKFWITSNLVLAVLLVAVSSQMRMMHMGPNRMTHAEAQVSNP
jgi:uncharacterized membrane protein